MIIIKILRIIIIFLILFSIFMINYNLNSTDRFFDFLDDIKDWSIEGTVQSIEIVDYTQTNRKIKSIIEKEIINEIIFLISSYEYHYNGDTYLEPDNILYQISINRYGYNTEVPVSFTKEFVVYNGISYSVDTNLIKKLIELFNSQF